MWLLRIKRGGCIGSWWVNRWVGDLRGPRRGWVDNIRMELQELVCWFIVWIGRSQHRDK